MHLTIMFLFAYIEITTAHLLLYVCIEEFIGGFTGKVGG